MTRYNKANMIMLIIIYVLFSAMTITVVLCRCDSTMKCNAYKNAVILLAEGASTVCMILLICCKNFIAEGITAGAFATVGFILSKTMKVCPAMKCGTVGKPAVITLSTAVLVISAVMIVLNIRKEAMQRKENTSGENTGENTGE